MQEKEHIRPGLMMSLLPVILLILMLGYTIIYLGLDIETGGSHIPLILGTGIAAFVASRLGYSWKEIQESMVKGITLDTAFGMRIYSPLF